MTDWEEAAISHPNVTAGPMEGYTQAQMLTAFLKGLALGRHTIDRNGQEPLWILKTDLWTEGVVPARELLSSSLREARRVGDFISKDTTCAIDISRETCRRAAKAPGHIAQADIRHLPFKDAAFDIIFDPSTIDHVPFAEARGVLEEYRNALRPGGILVLIFSHWGGTLTKASGGSYYAFHPAKVRAFLSVGFSIKAEYAIHCLNTQPAGKLTSDKLHCRNTMIDLFRWLEFTPLSRYLLRPVAPLYVMIAQVLTARKE
jgi:SAM-dependent methyltransferase